MKNLSDVGLRLSEYLKIKGIGVNELGKLSETSGAQVSNIINGRVYGFDKLLKIINVLPDIDVNWLINGNENGQDEGQSKGQYKVNLTSQSQRQSHSESTSRVEDYREEYSASKKSKGLPLIPVEAMAGFGVGEFSVLQHEVPYYNVPEFKGAEFLIRVKGYSMQPKYNNGDILACKYVNNPIFYQWNKVHVLDTSQGAMVKRLHPCAELDAIELRSDNIEYPSFTIPISDIRSLALVIGVIKLE